MEIKEMLAPLLRWWWLLILATGLAAGPSYWVARQQPPTYEARTMLMIGRALDNPNPTGQDIGLSQQLAAAYANIAQREAIREATMTALNLQTLPNYRVRALPNSQFVEIVVLDTNPARAQAVANELANQLVLSSPTAIRPEESEQAAFIENELTSLQDAITETRAEIAAKQEALRTMISAREIANTQNEIASLQTKLNLLRSNYASLLATTRQGAINTIAVVEQASLPRYPVGSNTLSAVLTAASIGFVMAATASYLLDYLDDTIKTTDEAARLSGLPVIASIAQFLPINETDEERALIAFEQPRSPVSEAFRSLRTAIQFADIDNEHRQLLITSGIANEGKSVVAANLAIVIAQAGHRVLLIDADLRRPSLHRLFNLPNKRGLTSLLLEVNILQETEKTEQRVAQDTQTPGLQLLSSGPLPPNPSELLGSAKMKELLGILTKRYDYIILDSAPILLVTDAVILSAMVDGVIYVARAQHSSRNQLRQGVDKLNKVNARTIGVSLNGVRHSEGYYHDPYASGYYGEQEVSPAKSRLRSWFLPWQRRDEQQAAPDSSRL